LEQEEERARTRMAELDERLVQLAADIERERRLAADAQAALSRLDAEETALRTETQTDAEKRAGADERVASAAKVLGEAEASFGALTGTLADLTARRAQHEDAVRTQSERLQRLAAEIGAVDAELRGLAAGDEAAAGLAAIAASVEQAHNAVTEAETAAL